MNTTTRIIAIAALAALTSFGAQAKGEGDNAPELQRSTSGATAAPMRHNQDRMARTQLENYSTGTMGASGSDISRAELKANTAAAVRSGQTSRGELGTSSPTGAM